MNSNQNLINYAMRGGLLLGLSMIACLATASFLPIFSIVAFFAMLVLYWRTISSFVKVYTEETLEGKFRFSHSFMMGVYISFFASMLVAVAVFLYLRFLMSAQDYTTMINTATDTLISLAKTEEEKAIFEPLRHTTPTDMAFSSMWNVIFTGTFFSLLVSLYYKFKNK